MPDMMSILKEMLTLTSNVGELKNEVGRLNDRVENHTERIIKLETREELLAQKMTNEAIKAVFQMNSQYFERLSTVERKVGLHSDSATSDFSLPKIEG